MSDVGGHGSEEGGLSAAGPVEPIQPVPPAPVAPNPTPGPNPIPGPNPTPGPTPIPGPNPTPGPTPIVVLNVTYTVTGQVTSPLSAAVGVQTVVLIDRNVGADVQLITGTTDTAGHFTLQASISSLVLAARHKSAPDLQVQVTQPMAGTNASTVVAASIVRYRASTVEELDVVLPATARIPSEFENLLADVQAIYPGALNAVQETDTQPDITFLANKTGWDARAVAMAAAAAQFASPPANTAPVPGAPGPQPEPHPEAAATLPLPAVSPGYYYALMRAGLAADPAALLRTSPQALTAVWQQAAAANIIPPALGAEAPKLAQAFIAPAVQSALSTPSPSGVSSLGDLLQVHFGPNGAAGQQQFATLLVQHSNDPKTLWAQATAAFGAGATAQLQLLGQLAFLTGDNAPLITALSTAPAGPPQTAQDLVTRGLYQPAAWLQVMGNLDPPAAITGPDPATRRATYADLLAAQVRLSLPSACIGQMATAGDFGQTVQGSSAGAFLLAHSDFDISDEPVGHYVNRIVAAGAPSPDPAAVAQVTRLQRLYQVTPDAGSMATLLNAGLDSSYAISRMPRSAFVQQHSAGLGGLDGAAAVYDRARTISSSTLHLALSYLTARRQPSIGTGAMGGLIKGSGTQATDALVAGTAQAQATLEDLFGNLDYCQCDDCQSITSPAAYMVDLLDWINNPAPSSGFTNPRAALLARRPDIGALPLTCDNTNTALPYLDVVNEILEYYVGNQSAPESLSGYAGFNDDGTVSSAELIASPQNDSSPAALNAFQILKGQWYPQPLPFYRDLELLRAHVSRLGSSLYEVMRALRPSESLEPLVPADPASYGWRDILAERIGLSRLEYRLLTDSTLALADLYGTGDLTVLASLQELSRRIDVSYDDIVAILQTRFLNPGNWLIPLVTALAVPFSTLKQLHDGTMTTAAFNAALPAGLDPADYGPGGPAQWVVANWDTITGLLVIDVGGTPCDTSAMVLQHLDGSPAQPVDFVRLLRFVRLWQKLGLGIQPTDDLIAALYQSTAPSGATDLQNLDSGFSNLLPHIGVAYAAVDQLGLDPTADLESLLACWAPIGTTGPQSLYATMFLNPTVLRLDPAFAPDVSGNLFTTSPTPHLTDHGPAICAALNLTAGELALITGPAPAGLGYDSSTPLSLDSISAIYRRAWLARALQLSVTEFLNLAVATAVDPFAVPVLDASHPVSSPLIDFATRAQNLSAANLQPVQALYLLWDQDLSGVSAPSRSLFLGLAATLRAAFGAIDSQFAVAGSVSAATAQALMALVLGPTAANLYFGLINGTFLTTIPFGYAQATLPDAVISAGQGHLTYDDLAKQLGYGGYLDNATLASLQTAAGGDAALVAGLATLAAASQQATDAFFATYDDPHTPYLRPLFDAYRAATVDPSTADVTAALAALLGGLLPVLGDLRKREQALTSAATAAGCDPSFASALLPVPAAIPAAGPAPATAGIDDLTAIGAGGLCARFYLSGDLSQPADQTIDVAGSLDYGPGADSGPLPAPSGGATSIAATWTGYASAPQDGNYNFSFTVDAGASVQLQIGDAPVPLASSAGGTVWANSGPVPLRAGVLVTVQITASGLTSGFSAAWQTLGTGWQPLPPAALYSDVSVAHLQTTTLRFLKATALAGDLSLTAPEIAFLATGAGLTVGGPGWLADLAVDGPPPVADYAALTAALDGVVGYAALKAQYAPLPSKTPQLLATLQDLLAGASAGPSELAALTGWDPASLAALLPRCFGGITTLAGLTARPGLLANLLRLSGVFALVKLCGLSAATLIEAATNDPTPASSPASPVLANFQSAVRSRYAEADWLAVVQPINDSLRQMQRDALVAYILPRFGPTVLSTLGISATANRMATADDLFNYFLIDTEMEPCMETSRIRSALSSIQLFIERSLRNLEPEVSPSDIDGEQWEWRKRYRVWQANREVFLWPENWLDPSLRDDQSPFFKTTMSQLLQSDITDDTAVAGYLAYLSNLETVAKLQPCALYYEAAPDGSGDDLAHVLARTAGAHRKHYYRRLSGGSWSPWEEVKLAIEDNPVAIYVWNGRLLIFWLQIHHTPMTAGNVSDSLPQTSSAHPTQTIADSTISDLSQSVGAAAPNLAQEQVGAVLYFSEYYNGAWQPTKSSDVKNPLDLGAYQAGAFDRGALYLRPWQPADPADGSLYVEVSTDNVPAIYRRIHNSKGVPGGGAHSAYRWGSTDSGHGFALHNTHSEPVAWSEVPVTELVQPTYIRGLVILNGYLTAAYGQVVSAAFPNMNAVTPVQGGWPETVEGPQPDVADQWFTPFFFGDPRSVFYVTTGQTWVPFHQSSGFGLGGRVSSINPGDIPPMAVAVGPPQPGDPVEIVGSAVDSGIAAEAVSQGAAKTVIAGGGAFTFAGRTIGVTGSISALDGAVINVDGEKGDS